MGRNSLEVVRRWVGNSKAWVESFLRDVRSHPSIVAVVVMGSAVRPRGHRRSDLDLVVLYTGPRPKIKSPVEVDIRYYSVENVDQKIAAGHEVLCWALKFGTAVFDPEGLWESRKGQWGNRIPLPSAIEAEQRASRSLGRAKEMLIAEDETAASDLVLAALTQFVRARLIENGVFPASRPELPSQLRRISPGAPLAQLLEDAMYRDVSAHDLVQRLDRAVTSAIASYESPSR